MKISLHLPCYVLSTPFHNMREIIQLGAGQAGCTVSNAIWEQLGLDLGVSQEGALIGEEGAPSMHFCEYKSRHVPRSVLVDCDSDIRASRRLSASAVNEAFESDGLFWSMHEKKPEKAAEALRVQAEGCDSLQGFTLTSAVSGGVGSGLSVQLLKHLKKEYGKKAAICLPIYPS